MWQFHEMRLFMFARKHIKIFRNSRLSELETTVFGEMFVRIYFLNLFFFSFLFTLLGYQSWYQVKKLKLYLGILCGFLCFFQN